jgi:hypothetical protein
MAAAEKIKETEDSTTGEILDKINGAITNKIYETDFIDTVREFVKESKKGDREESDTDPEHTHDSEPERSTASSHYVP